MYGRGRCLFDFPLFRKGPLDVPDRYGRVSITPRTRVRVLHTQTYVYSVDRATQDMGISGTLFRLVLLQVAIGVRQYLQRQVIKEQVRV